MSSKININLSFTADTSQAKAQLENLQQSLNNIVNSTKISSGGQLGITKQIQEGVQAAAELQVHLNKAVNTDTGNLDFSKLSQSLKQSGTSLQQYGAKLQKLGPTGQQAFQQLAQSVAQSEIPIRRSSQLLDKMAYTFKNTLRWQLSSSVLHAFTGAISSAFNYAKDLNESLNNIRIVTGKNTEEMAQFAEQANRAAKALSTTTTAYSDAALIFYQQGLEGKAVTERAETVIKLANVTKQSAEEVSSQMTAIWNNFYDGSKNLEYYADVLTKLGAATASSTDEIAGGLEKFAAVGETIGLSYEYAAAALATITAQTRQSEDVVGTALKTIFARIQGLKLGESLEDGTNLNKYSEALQAVGISIFDQNNELKDMDDILDEMGAKWDTLSKAQQTALAQTVAGVRQYNQLISLMDNWDFMQQNVSIAENSSGELNKQQKIYEESWEAASKRVKASLEDIYDSLIDDEFFIDLTNGLAKLLDFVGQFIDSLGGLRGVLAGIGVLVTRIFEKQISASLVSAANSLSLLTQSGKNKLATERTAFLQDAKASVNPNGDTTGVNYAREQALNNEIVLSEKLREKAHLMTEEELAVNKILLDRQRLLDQELVTEEEKLAKLKEQRELEAGLNSDMIDAESTTGVAATANKKAWTEFTDTVDKEVRVGDISKQIRDTKLPTNITKDSTTGLAIITPEDQMQLDQFKEKFAQLDQVLGTNEYSSIFDGLLNDLKEGKITAKDFNEQLGRIKDRREFTTINGSKVTSVAARQRNSKTNIRKAKEKLGSAVKGKISDDGYEKITKSAETYIGTTKKVVAQEKKVVKATKESKTNLDNTGKTFDKTKKSAQSWSTTITQAASALMSFSMGLSAIKGLVSAIEDPNMSGWEKFTSILMSASMAIMGFMSVAGSLNSILGSFQAAQTNIITQLSTEIGLRKVVTGEITKEQLAKKMGITIDQAAVAIDQLKAKAILEQVAAGKLQYTEEQKSIIAKRLGISLEQADTIAKKMATGATFEEAAAENGVNLVKGTGLKTKIASISATVSETVAKAAESGATWAQVVANIALQTSMTPLLVITIALVAAIGLLVAAFAGISWLIGKVSDAYNADAIAAQKAEEAAKGLAEAAEEAKSRLSDITSDIDEYNGLIDKLNECTKGTEEWNEAMKAVNDKMTDMLTKYPELLSQKELFNKDGTFNEKALADFEAQAELRADKAANAAMLGQANAQHLRAISNQTDMIRDTGYFSENSRSYGEVTLTNMGLALIPGLGPLLTVVNSIKYGIGLIGGAVEDATQKNQLEKLAKQFDIIGEEALTTANVAKELGINLEDASAEQMKYIESVQETVRAVEQAADGIRNANKKIIADWAAETGTELSTGETAIMAGVATDAYNKIYDDVIKKDHEKNYQALGDDASGQWERYLKATGQQLELTDNGIQGNDDDRVYEYYKDGEKKTIPLEEMARAIASAESTSDEALQKQAEEAQKITEKQFKANDGDQSRVDAMSEYLSKSGIVSLTEQEIQELSDANAEKIQQITGMTHDQLVSTLGDNYVEIFKQDIKEAQENFDKIGQKFLDNTVANQFNNLTKGYELSTVQALEKLYMNANKEEAEHLTQLLSQVQNEEDLEKIALALKEQDLTSITAVEDIYKVLKDQDVKISKELVENLVKSQRNIDNVAVSLQSIYDQMAAIKEVVGDDGLKIGDIITQEQLDLLLKFNTALGKYFSYIGANQYEFTGDPLDFQQELKQTYNDKLKEQLESSKHLFAVSSSEIQTVRQDLDQSYGAIQGFHNDFGSSIRYFKPGTAGEDLKATLLGGAYDSAFNFLEASGLSKTDEEARNLLQGKDELIEAISKKQYLAEDVGLGQLKEVGIKTYGQLPVGTVYDANLKQHERRDENGNVLDVYQYTGMDETGTMQYKHLTRNTEESPSFTSPLQGQATQNILSKGDGTYWTLDDQGDSTNTTKVKDFILEKLDAYESAQKEAEAAMYQYASSLNDRNDIQEALKEGIINERAASAQLLKMREQDQWEDIDPKEVEEYAKHLMEVAENSDLLDDSLANDQEAAEEVARSVIRMNQGIETLKENQEEWISVLRKSDDASQEYSKAMKGTKKALADVLDVSESYVSDDFVIKHLKEIEKAAKGDEKAIEKLRKELNKDIIANIIVNNNLSEEEIANVLSYLDEIPDLEIGVSLKAEEVVEGVEKINNAIDGAEPHELEIKTYTQPPDMKPFQDLVDAAHMSVDDANAAFDSMGYDVEFVTSPQVVKQDVPNIVTRTYSKELDGDYGEGVTAVETWSESFNRGYTTHSSVQELPAMKAVSDGKGGTVEVPQIKTIRKKTTGALNNSSSRNPGGGGSGGSKSKPKKIEKTKKKDVVERYLEINKTLEAQSALLEDLTSLSDELYGEAKFNALMAYNNELERENDLIEEKINLNKVYQKEDLAALSKFGATFDADGNISNAEEILTGLFEKKRKAEDAADKIKDSEAQSEYIEKHLDPIQEEIDAFTEAMGDWNDTMSVWNEEQQKLIDNHVKKIQNVIDAYDALLEQIEEQIAFIDKKIDVSWGEDTDALYAERSKKIAEKETKATEKVEDLKKLRKEDNDELYRYLSAEGITAKYGEDGQISNIDEIYKAFKPTAAANTDEWKKQSEKETKVHALLSGYNTTAKDLYYYTSGEFDFDIEQEKKDSFWGYVENKEGQEETTESYKKSIRDRKYIGLKDNDFDGRLEQAKDEYDDISQDLLDVKEMDIWLAQYAKDFGKDATYWEKFAENEEKRTDAMTRQNEAIRKQWDIQMEKNDYLQEIAWDNLEHEAAQIDAMYYNLEDNDFKNRQKFIEEQRKNIIKKQEQNAQDIKTLQNEFAHGWIDEDEYKKQLHELEQQGYDLAKESTDLFKESIELAWEEFDYKLELKISLIDEEKFRQEVKELFIDTEDYAAQANLGIDKLLNADMAMETIRKTMAEMEETAWADRDQEWLDRYKDLNDKLKGYMEEVKSGLEEMTKIYTDALKYITTEYADAVKDMDNLSKQLDHFKKVMDLTGRKKDYDNLAEIYDAQLTIQKDQLNVLLAEKNTLLSERNRIMKQLADPTLTDQVRKQLEKQLEEVDKAIETNGNSINANIEKQLQHLNTMLTNEMAKARETIESALTGGLSFADITEDLNWLNKSQEEYLTKTNQLYNVGKIIREAQLEADKTDNLLMKQKYQAQIAELKEIQNKEKLSNQDLKIAQARFNLLKAQIALEEAQKAKDSMRLVRGADGNWNYVYTANQEKISELEGKVEDAENALYNVGLSGVKSFQTKINQIDKEAIDAIDKLNKRYRDGEINDEQYQKEKAQLIQHYTNLREGYETEYYNAVEVMQQTSAQHTVDYDTLKIKSTGDWATEVSKYIQEVDNITEKYGIETEKVTSSVETNYDNISSSVKDVNTQQDILAQDVEEKLIPALSNLQTELSKISGYYSDIANNASKATKEMEGTATAASNTITTVSGLIADKTTDAKYDSVDTDSISSEESAEEREENIKEANKDVHYSGLMLDAILAGNTKAYDAAMSARKVKEKTVNPEYTTDQIDEMLKFAEKKGLLDKLVNKNDKQWWMILRAAGFSAFDTGGYTGEWGPQGKLAMLHQKEIVLNAKDTSNLLSAVGLVRQLTKELDLQTNAYQYALSNLKSDIALLHNQDTLQQEVTIHANFPNVSSRKEIEDAFSNLVNEAAQYASEKRLRGF